MSKSRGRVSAYFLIRRVFLISDKNFKMDLYNGLNFKRLCSNRFLPLITVFFYFDYHDFNWRNKRIQKKSRIFSKDRKRHISETLGWCPVVLIIVA